MTIGKLKEKIEEIISQPPTCDCDKCIDKFALHKLFEEDILASICLTRLLKTIAVLLNNEKAVADYIQVGYFNNITSLCGDIDTFRKVLKMINEITENENTCPMEIE